MCIFGFSSPLPLPLPVSLSLIKKKKSVAQFSLPYKNYNYNTIFFNFIPRTPIQPINFLQYPLAHPNSSIKLYGSLRNLLGPFCSNSTPSVSISEDFDVELGRMLSLLPEGMRCKISEHLERHQLIEVIMDLGGKPLARFPSGDVVLSDHPITMEDNEHATSLNRPTELIANFLDEKLRAGNLKKNWRECLI